MKNITFTFLLFSFLSFGQNNINLSYYLPQHNSYNKSIPTPKQIIGHQIGKWHITHDKLVQYMYALAEASDRITIENRGKTYEDRPLLLLKITLPKNHKNLEDIQKQHIKATESDNANLNSRAIVVYQGFSIHGNEASGSNASLLLAYHLAASNSKEVISLLDNTIILLDPSFNPDGLQRFAYWANTNKNRNLNPDPNDREYSEVWPGGRTNHYWFDMNRDWLPVQLPESQARIKTFHQWLPNILTDHHEMGSNSTFFFQPGVPSRTHPLTPKRNQELTKKIAQFHANALDKLGSLYYSEERFDDFYYGKGSTFPDINGSIGILFEQASSRGHLQNTTNGILTFPFTIKNQLTTALSTLEAAYQMREDILEYQHEFYKNARQEASKLKDKALIFGSSNDAARSFHLAEILTRHQIQLYDLKQDVTIDGIQYKKDYSYIVPTNQKNNRLINAMFEKRTTFKDSLFYDVSAWTLPLAFNLNYSDNVTPSFVGKELQDIKLKVGKVSAKSNYAYLIAWHEYYTPKLLHKVLAKRLRVKVAMKPFSLNGKLYDYGTIMIPVQNQQLDEEKIYRLLSQLSKTCYINIDAVNTGLTEGIDLGSNNFRPLKKPKIALLVGEGVRSYDAGEIWHLLDTRYNIAVTKLDTKSLENVNLDSYNVLIIPSINTLNDKKTNKVKAWLQQGGTLIAYRNTLKWLQQKELVKLEFKTMKDTARTITYEDKNKFHGAQVIGGAIFEAIIDRSHPINFGFSNNKIALFRNTRIFMKPDSQSYNNPIQYTNNPLLSGYISKTNLDSLKTTVPLQIKSLGKGKVIAFTDNTNFRAFWYGTNKLLMNAIFFRKEF